MKSSDVVIVGGGAVGCATAYFLSQAGANVTVIEKNRIAFGASGYAMGLLSPLYGMGIPGPLEGLSLNGFLMHRDLAAELPDATGVDYHAHPHDSIYLSLSDEDEEGTEGHRFLLRQRRWGLLSVAGETTTPEHRAAIDPRRRARNARPGHLGAGGRQIHGSPRRRREIFTARPSWTAPSPASPAAPPAQLSGRTRATSRPTPSSSPWAPGLATLKSGSASPSPSAPSRARLSA